ncbi:BamA/TamA family outer membrane protein [Pedobacter lithocola]|uniref:BamA/TamA family outer membrane protein n=1 Tax=Pedobacter lithocola TaxID=1908239 RepID=A0ABV8P782_9SPHI
MKAYKSFKYSELKSVAILLFIIVLIQACSSTKYIPDYQAIVKKVTIDSIDAKFEEQAYNYIQKDIRPSSSFSINVPLYNLFNTKDGRYKTTDIKPFGTPPAILDSTLVEISRTQIEKFLKGKGYFQAKVTSDIKIKDKKAEVNFKAQPGPASFVRNLSDSIFTPAVRNAYRNEKPKFTHLHEGMQYDSDSLSYEREQVYRVMKENGFYSFLRPFVNFDVIETRDVKKVDLRMNITNPPNGNHKQYTIGTTYMIIAPSPEGFPDSLRNYVNRDTTRGISFTDLSKRYRRNPILRYDFLKRGEMYDVRNENLTYDRLYELNIFKNVKIDYYNPDSTSNKVNPIILLTPQKVMSNRVEGEVPFNGGTVGFTLSNTYTNNNLFRGAERFELQLKGGLQSRIGNGASPFSDIYQRDFSISSSISVPRLMIPFYRPILGANGMPHTTFSTSYIYALQKDVSVRRIFINSITYDWVETKSKLHSFTPLNFEYRFGSLDYDKISPSLLMNNQYYVRLLDRKDFTLGMKYTYTLNADKLNQLRTFVYLRGNIETAGNMLQLLSQISSTNHDPSNGDYAKILGLPFNQYVRPEIDVRWYKHLGGDRQFVARLNTGVGYAYGNSVGRGIPFEKLFFAGGSSGVRAWQARTIGPGNYNRETLDSAQRQSFFGLDQLGEMRIETNLEYRTIVLRKFFGGVLKGAAFVDAGNVWNLTASDGEEKMFKLSKLVQQLAIGTGVGLRYDVQYFVFRFDIGLKLKDPQFSGSDQWVISKFLSGGRAFKNAYNATHTPDTYRFLQYNFGIGMPF